MLHLEAPNFSSHTGIPDLAFFEKLAQAEARVLLLDYDGTIARFSVDRRRALPYPPIPPLLERIRTESNTRVVIVSGRRASDVVPLLGMERIEIWGSHGLERLRADGVYELPEIDERTLRALAQAHELLEQEGLVGLLEVKPAGTAVHWRGRGDIAGEVLSKVQRVWARLPNREGLRMEQFDGGVEIRVARRNKGDVVRTILSETRPDAAVAYLGDDATDEEAFAAMHGHGLSILVGRENRPSAAEVWISPPLGVVAFLADWIVACGGAS
jgi:trehalose 6-phosphate phosphatase